MPPIPSPGEQVDWKKKIPMQFSVQTQSWVWRTSQTPTVEDVLSTLGPPFLVQVLTFWEHGDPAFSTQPWFLVFTFATAPILPNWVRLDGAGGLFVLTALLCQVVYTDAGSKIQFNINLDIWTQANGLYSKLSSLFVQPGSRQ
jgi:hypothetical protein